MRRWLGHRSPSCWHLTREYYAEAVGLVIDAEAYKLTQFIRVAVPALGDLAILDNGAHCGIVTADGNILNDNQALGAVISAPDQFKTIAYYRYVPRI